MKNLVLWYIFKENLQYDDTFRYKVKTAFPKIKAKMRLGVKYKIITL